MRTNIQPSLILSTILALFLFACSKPIKDETVPQLAGDWQWVSTRGGVGNNINETPASTGKNVELKLTAANGYSVYVNGALVAQGTYTVSTAPCIHGQDNKQWIDFSGSGYYERDMMIHGFDQVNLASCDNAYDGVQFAYTRK